MTAPHDEPGTDAADQIPDMHGKAAYVEGPHGTTADHGDGGHGHDDHGHASEALGPIDWRMWGVGVLGVVVGLMVAAGFVAATNFQFTA